MTVNLIQPAVDARDRAAEREHLTKTDVVNRALQAYDWLTSQDEAGGVVLVRHADGETERVRFL